MNRPTEYELIRILNLTAAKCAAGEDPMGLARIKAVMIDQEKQAA